MANLYKYMSADVADVLLVDDNNFSIKFSHLHEYNDPYEFFLTISYQRSAQELAFYNEMISMIQKQPVSCFSKSPINIPMWAHYANNSAGFVIEIDEEKLMSHISSIGFENVSSINDVQYYDTPSEEIEQYVQRAYHICKPRYIAYLQRLIRISAYLRKKTCWNYELERRLILSDDALIKPNDKLMILAVPLNCIKSIIIGPKADSELKNKLTKVSKLAQCKIYQMIIGKSTSMPYLIDDKNKTLIFNGFAIKKQKSSCKKCFEPVSPEQKICSWCSITQKERNDAAYRNSFRMLDRAGILESYLKNHGGIIRKTP